jgi:hypothetical protein
MPGRHNCADTPSCFLITSEGWEAELGLSDLCEEDSAQIGPVGIAFGATGQYQILNSFLDSGRRVV